MALEHSPKISLSLKLGVLLFSFNPNLKIEKFKEKYLQFILKPRMADFRY